MRGAFQIVTLFRIPVRIHWTFLLLLAWVVYSSQSRGGDIRYTIWSSLLVLTIFLCVVMHEFGHALTARRYGVNTQDIILSPIGGIARLDRLPEKPLQEFMVAIAGPLVNVGIALFLAPILFLFFSDETLQLWNVIRGVGIPSNEESTNFFAFYAPSIFFLNLILAGFNMLPAFPMDGGRIFRALLSIRFGRIRATRIAVIAGQSIAVLLALYGIWQFNLITIFIAAFVFLTATQELRSIQWEAVLSKHRIQDAMRPVQLQVHPEMPIQVPIDALKRSLGLYFIITDPISGQIQGSLSDQQLLAILKNDPDAAALTVPVREFMAPAPTAINAEQTLKEAFDQIHQTRSRFMPVVDAAGQLIGTIDLSAIQNFVQLQVKILKLKKANPIVN